jgi:hypothetical protein
MNVFHQNTEVRHWIQDYGFMPDTRTVIGLPCQYEICVHSKSDLYCIWVGVDFDNLMAHIYVEYNCGGEVSRGAIDLSNIDVEDEDKFMAVLDDIINDYVEECYV